MRDISDETLAAFLQACHDVAGRGLTRCSSGNLSWRVDEKHMLATVSRSWMGRLTVDDVTVCRIDDASVLDGKKPTIEITFHAGILRARPDVDVVMHFQTPHATALACRESGDVNYFVIPEIPFYIGPIARVPFYLPGSGELAHAVTEAMRDHDMVIMGNHGQVTVARDFDHVIQNAEFFELACQVIVRGGDAVTPLSPEAVRALLALRQEASRPAV